MKVPLTRKQNSSPLSKNNAPPSICFLPTVPVARISAPRTRLLPANCQSSCQTPFLRKYRNLYLRKPIAAANCQHLVKALLSASQVRPHLRRARPMVLLVDLSLQPPVHDDHVRPHPPM